jgi:predicted acetyltransferase
MKINITPASKELMPVIQNMARFYAYDLSKSCGFYELFDWSFPENGLYEGLDVSKYWEPNCYPFIIRVDNELAGFALINKTGSVPEVDWNMGEFFIVGKYQGKGIGKQVAFALFNKFHGQWEVRQMPPNLPAIKFWKKIVAEYSQNQFTETTTTSQKPKPRTSHVLRFTVHPNK